MDDSDGDMVYSVTVDIAADTIEYKFTLDGWTAQEEFAGGESCTSTIDGFTNRSYIVDGDATLPVVCYNSCDACDGNGGGEGPTTYAVTFQVDMSDYTGSYGAVNLNGSFAGWCGGCIAMDDSDGDMVYSVTVDIVPDTIEYKFTLDGWTAQEEFAGGESCTSTIDGFTNRSYIVAADATLPVVCYNSCDACDGDGGGGPTPSDSLAVTFSVDMNNYGGTFGFVNVSGTWNDFCGDCNQMADDDMDGIWTAINLPQVKTTATSTKWMLGRIKRISLPTTILSDHAS